MISTLIVPLGAFIYFKLKRSDQFLVLSLAALLPLSFGDFRSLPSFLIIEWLPFVTLLMLFNDLVPINRPRKRLQLISFRGIEIFIFALFLLIVRTVFSFLEHEIFTETLSYVEKTGTTRVYFNIVNNVLLFFTIFVFVNVYFEKIDFEKFFKILLYFSLFLGTIRIMSHFLDFNIPLISGEFNYGKEYGKFSKIKYGGTAYRIGGLNHVVSIGIPALFSHYLYSKKMNYVALVIFMFFLFLSGGRTIAVGTIIPIIIFSFIFFPRNLIYLVVGSGILLILAVILLPEGVLTGQAGRMTTFKKGFMGMDLSRTLAWKKYLEIFMDNPLWGKGITDFSGFIYDSKTSSQGFVYDQLVAGGHGSYISLLSTFGLVGITYFIIMIFGGIILSYKKINQYLNNDTNKTAIAVFTFMLLMLKAIESITGGNGLDLPYIFYAVGLIASISIHKYGLGNNHS